MILLTGFDVPSRPSRLVDPEAVPDHLAPEAVDSPRPMRSATPGG
ncbi:hypothetical protein ACIQ1J_23115 [Streptomyces sp. NPDC097107]